jgi:phospholipid/cholesterol/gamma-HCH transport system permease protein
MVRNPFAAIGAATIRVVDEFGKIGIFAAQTVRHIFTPPVRTRLFVKEIYKLGVLSLTIVVVSGFAVGMVLSMQGYNTLVDFGATGSLGAMVGLSLIRELGPVLTGLLVTGRAGSATTAEIGTMVATEQLDGLRMMSVNPVDLVVVPRAVAMTLVMPLLSALFIVSGIFGGYLIGVEVMGVDGGSYMSSLTESVSFRGDVICSIVKGIIFGMLTGLISTYRGCTAKPTSAGVSAATTSTVVIGSVSILIFDFFITALWGS